MDDSKARADAREKLEVLKNAWAEAVKYRLGTAAVEAYDTAIRDCTMPSRDRAAKDCADLATERMHHKSKTVRTSEELDQMLKDLLKRRGENEARRESLVKEIGNEILNLELEWKNQVRNILTMKEGKKRDRVKK